MFWLAVASAPEQLTPMADPRLLIEERLGAGARLELNEAQTRHAGTVLRLDAGDTLRVFNAEDGEWRARISERSKRTMSVRVEDFLRPARATPDLELLFAPVKRHATDLIAEKATELGVRRLRPVTTQRTIAETVRTDRLMSIAREAAEQTERFDLPEIAEVVSLTKALDGWRLTRPLIFADEEGEAPPIVDVLRTFSLAEKVASEREPDEGRRHTRGVATLADIGATERPSPPTPSPQGRGGLSLLIGPEGGFTAEERRMLRALAFVKPVTLGPRILRAETAVIAALSLIQGLWGDWRA
ncbi:MAG TPA: 16S rRNA (uracil(1498)-N(3))-methyltransferase [Vitreimonas sp.]|jgi:16S rRNA (uracil1498-N3)-methyltransferase|nr:16S rRNA (uracil(1498)-N(3))-methyltransferase [Vitreimonas sp.]